MKEYTAHIWIEGRGHIWEKPCLFYKVYDREGELVPLGTTESIGGKRIDAAVGKLVGSLKHLVESEGREKIGEFRASYIPVLEDPAAGWEDLRADLSMPFPTYGKLDQLIRSTTSAPGITDLRFFAVPDRTRTEREEMIHRVWDCYLSERRGPETREFDGIIEYFSERRLPITEIKGERLML
ncbi:hypothetical protein J4210_00380 [Candidatus Woesearchaeota archaeon]|nr:hypothetical protein [Candidatus Woesearchaeota archaeon]